MSYSDLPTHVEYNTVLLRPSSRLGADLHQKPFSLEVWISILAAAILTAVCLSMMSLVHGWNVHMLSKAYCVYAKWIGGVQKQCWLVCSAVLLQCGCFYLLKIVILRI